MVKRLTLDEIADMLKVPEKKIKNWRKTGVIPKNCFFKIGGTVYGIETEILNWLNSYVTGN